MGLRAGYELPAADGTQGKRHAPRPGRTPCRPLGGDSSLAPCSYVQETQAHQNEGPGAWG